MPAGVRYRGDIRPDAARAAEVHGLPIAAGRPAAHSGIRSVDLHLHRLVLRTDARICRDTLLSREPLRLFGGADGASDYALADCPGDRGSDRRSTCRALP